MVSAVAAMDQRPRASIASVEVFHQRMRASEAHGGRWRYHDNEPGTVLPVDLRSWVKRSIPEPLEPLVRSVLVRYRLARGPLHARDRALRVEVAFWDRWLTRGGSKLEDRLAPRLTDRAVVECVSRIPAADVSILDVGAGPLTTLGTAFPGKRILLTATDPLADKYDRVLREHRITPPVRTIQCAGEHLVSRFGHDCFDIAFSENALDHTFDPLTILHNMLAIVKPGRFVVLNHFRNEGQYASYGQLHQWNFDEQCGRGFLWRGPERCDIEEALLGKAVTECWRERRPGEVKERVVCIITKIATAKQLKLSSAVEGEATESGCPGALRWRNG
jgi:hypothetical protein